MKGRRFPDDPRFLSQIDMISKEVIARTWSHYIPASDSIVDDILGEWLDDALDGGRYDVHDELKADWEGVPYDPDDSPFPFSDYNTVGQFLKEEVLARISVFQRQPLRESIHDCIASFLCLEVHDAAIRIFCEQRADILKIALGEQEGEFHATVARDGIDEDAIIDSFCDPVCDANIELDALQHIASLPFRETLARIRPEILEEIESEETSPSQAP